MSLLNKVGEPYLSWVRFVGMCVVVSAVGLSYYKVYMHGKEVCQMESAKAELDALREGVQKFTVDVEAQRKKNAQATAAAQNLSSKLYGLGEQLRGFDVGCDISDERLRIMDEAAKAVNATGFAGNSTAVRPMAGASKKYTDEEGK